jgi:hypothetical protein
MGASGYSLQLLHFGSGIEEYQQVGPDLFGLARARVRARDGRQRGGMQRDAGRPPEAVCSMSPA